MFAVMVLGLDHMLNSSVGLVAPQPVGPGSDIKPMSPALSWHQGSPLPEGF